MLLIEMTSRVVPFRDFSHPFTFAFCAFLHWILSNEEFALSPLLKLAQFDPAEAKMVPFLHFLMVFEPKCKGRLW